MLTIVIVRPLPHGRGIAACYSSRHRLLDLLSLSEAVSRSNRCDQAAN